MRHDEFSLNPRVGQESVSERRQIGVLLCDDHEMVRDYLAGQLRYLPEFEVVGQASDGVEAVERWRELRPDVTVMDLRMPVMDGFEAIARIRREDEDARILVLSASEEDSAVLGAHDEGVAGYILKNAPREELFDAIRAVAKGADRYSQGPLSLLLRDRRDGPAKGLGIEEKRMLGMVAEGMTIAQISVAMRISERTVKDHLKKIRERIGAKNSTHAATLAIQRGLIRVDDG